MVQFQVPAPLGLLPQLERARRGLRGSRAGAVGPTDPRGLTARAGARSAGPPGVHQRDADAAPQQVERGPTAEGPCADHHHVPLLTHRTPALQKGRRAERRARGGAGLEELPPRDAPHVGVTRGVRASRTAARTASRSAGGRLGPQGSSHASSGITPSAASAQSIRRTYPSTGGSNVALAKRSHTPDRRTNLPKSPERNDSIRATWRSVSAAPMPINAARAPIVSE